MSIKFEHEKFDRTLQWYAKVSTRTFADICNTKAYYIARAAVRFTEKANAEKIRTELTRPITTARSTNKGRTTGGGGPPLAALIINARRKRMGQPGLSGEAMAQAVQKLISVRLRSVAFIKAGWIPAIKTLAGYAKSKGSAPATDTSARQVGADKGSATPAFEGHTMAAKILNHAIARHEKNNALQKYGERGLQQAFDSETASMVDYIIGEWKGVTDEANAKLK